MAYLKAVTRVPAPSLGKSKHTTTLCHSSVLPFCPGSGTVLLVSVALSRASLSRFSFFLSPTCLFAPFPFASAAGVVLNSSHSRCLFARFNCKVLHCCAQCCERPSNAVYTRSLIRRSARSVGTFDSPRKFPVETQFDRSDLTLLIANEVVRRIGEKRSSHRGWKMFPIRCIAMHCFELGKNIFTFFLLFNFYFTICPAGYSVNFSKLIFVYCNRNENELLYLIMSTFVNLLSHLFHRYFIIQLCQDLVAQFCVIIFIVRKEICFESMKIALPDTRLLKKTLITSLTLWTIDS